jgi:2-deoxy-D-gluconate 3-dehydrogenase
VPALAADAEPRPGRIDVLVNNAGTIRRHPAVDYPLDDWDAVLRPNLDAVFLLSQAVGRGMVARGRGKIVNVASLLSFSGGVTVPGVHGEQARGRRAHQGARQRVGAPRRAT